jgi:hypothetical protein
MKNKIRYTHEPIKIGKLVADFLPSPEYLIRHEKNCVVSSGTKRGVIKHYLKKAATRPVPHSVS